MTYWPFWMGGIALASVALLHWLLLHKLMSVTSRFSSIIDSARGLVPARPEPLSEHLLFFVGIALGGLVATLLPIGGAGTWQPTLFDVGASFASFFGRSPIVTALVMVTGGMLVGFGTRMATGCTSGHGLCGVARLEKGSLLATCCFFGTGVIVSFLMNAVLR